MSTTRTHWKSGLGVAVLFAVASAVLVPAWLKKDLVLRHNKGATQAMDSRAGAPEILLRDVFTANVGTVCAVTGTKAHAYELSKYSEFEMRGTEAEHVAGSASPPATIPWTLVWSEKDGTASAGRVTSPHIAIQNALAHNNKHLDIARMAKDCAPIVTAKLVRVSEGPPFTYVLVDEADAAGGHKPRVSRTPVVDDPTGALRLGASAELGGNTWQDLVGPVADRELLPRLQGAL